MAGEGWGWRAARTDSECMEQPWEVSQAWLGAGGQLGASVQDGGQASGLGKEGEGDGSWGE